MNQNKKGLTKSPMFQTYKLNVEAFREMERCMSKVLKLL